MTLSADTLNQRSPYALMQLGELTFRFVTDQQIHYTVGFYKDTIFMDDGAYHFFIDNSENEHGSYDPKIHPLHDHDTLVLSGLLEARAATVRTAR